MWRRSRIFYLVSVLLWSALSAGYSEDLSSLPPFDQTKTYQVPGTLLEQLRLEWLKLTMESKTLKGQVEELKQAKTQLEASFDAYRTEVENRLTQVQADKEFWMIMAGLAGGTAIGIGIAFFGR